MRALAVRQTCGKYGSAKGVSHAAHEIEPNLNVGCAELLLTNANTSGITICSLLNLFPSRCDDGS
jgi:hypothetical protein